MKWGAIFDWDGVIINSAAHHETSWERLSKECGKALPANHFKRGFGMKNEVIIPEYSRNVYDHAIRMVGVKVIEVKDPSELEGAFNSRTAMAYILAGPGDDGPLGTKVIAEAARRSGAAIVASCAVRGLETAAGRISWAAPCS